MTSITVHENKPSEDGVDDYKMRAIIVRGEVHEFIRRMESKGLKEIWVYEQNGQTVAMWNEEADDE